MPIKRSNPILYPEKVWFNLKEIEEYLAQLRKEGYQDNTEIRVSTMFGPVHMYPAS